MKQILIILSLLSLTCTSIAYSQDGGSKSVPQGVIAFQIANNETEDESSKVVGIEGGWNINPSNPLVFGLHAAYQKQSYGSFSESRLALGLSGNYYFDYREDLTVNLGLKFLGYFGMGNTEEALDCLYCSNTEEDYSGKNSFVTLGFNFEKLYLGVDYRISDSKSEWSENAYDPWGVGSSYSSSYDGIPDPEYVLNIGYLFNN
ncbi:MAG: hypothetical protein NZ811_04085 [Gammaproteobacteria bacterium]|nr:hypothetical protein [Gammaproteobacteria bacterium]